MKEKLKMILKFYTEFTTVITSVAELVNIDRLNEIMNSEY